MESRVSRARRGILYVTAAAAVAVPIFVWLVWYVSSSPAAPVVVPVALAEATPIVAAAPPATEFDPTPHTRAGYAALAQRDPVALIQLGHERFEREVHDYRCVLLKQELLSDGLSPIQEIEVRVRQTPRAIFMLWQQNATKVKRALFKEDPQFVDKQGRPMARVEPAGAVVRLFCTDIFMPIKGEQAQQTSRRTIDECGFAASFDLAERYAQIAREDGVLDVCFSGIGEVDGRPTFVITRRLPYTGDNGVYPDAKMVLHLDEERLLPVAIESYANQEGTKLLGRYVFTKVELNPGLTESDFQF
jgi:hypothetical protein